jgi:flagellar biosynthesis protein FlhG
MTLAANEHRTLLLDADLHRQDAATMCGLQEDLEPPQDWEPGGDLSRLTCPGPHGVLVMTARAACGHANGRAIWSLSQLLDRCLHDASLADWIIVDAGNDSRWHVGALWQRAHEVLVVTTPEIVSVIDTYATVKRAVHGGEGKTPRIRVIVNQAPEADAAQDAHRRLANSCRRFLGLNVQEGGWVRGDPAIALNNNVCGPVSTIPPGGAAQRQLLEIAERLQARRESDAETGVTGRPCDDLLVSQTEEPPHLEPRPSPEIE